MPTIVGMRRRGYTPEAIRAFCDRIGVAKRENMVDVALLEHAVREDLNRRAPRVMGVLDPLRVVIENYPEGESEAVRGRQQSRRRCGRDAAACRSRACSTSSATTSAKIRRRSSSASPRARSAAARRLLHHLHGRRQGSRDGRDRRAALHLRSGDARRRRARRPQGQVDAALGLGRARDRASRSGSTIGCSRARIPAAIDDYRSRCSTRTRSRCSRAAGLEPSVAGAAAGTRYQFERLGYFCVDRRFDCQTASSSTAPSRSRTPGPESSSAAEVGASASAPDLTP